MDSDEIFFELIRTISTDITETLENFEATNQPLLNNCIDVYNTIENDTVNAELELVNNNCLNDLNRIDIEIHKQSELRENAQFEMKKSVKKLYDLEKEYADKINELKMIKQQTENMKKERKEMDQLKEKLSLLKSLFGTTFVTNKFSVSGCVEKGDGAVEAFHYEKSKYSENQITEKLWALNSNKK